MPSEMQPNVRLLPKTNTCYVCGPENASGLHVPFVSDGAHGSSAAYTARAEHCGWPGLLHGGVAFALMDEALAWACYFQGLYGVTARIQARFRQPIPVGTKLIVRAWTLERNRRLVNARAEIRLDAHGGEQGAVVAEADATMYLPEANPSRARQQAAKAVSRE